MTIDLHGGQKSVREAVTVIIILLHWQWSCQNYSYRLCKVLVLYSVGL